MPRCHRIITRIDFIILPRKWAFTMKFPVFPSYPYASALYINHPLSFSRHPSMFTCCIRLPLLPETIFSDRKQRKMAPSLHSARTSTAQATPISCDPNKSQIDDHLCSYKKFHSPISQNQQKPFCNRPAVDLDGGGDDLWLTMKDEAKSSVELEPILSSYYFGCILSRDSLSSALANHLSEKLSNSFLPSGTLYDLFLGLLVEDQEIMRAVRDDLRAVKERDPACISYVQCFLSFKGFLACQAHRVAHKLWSKGRKTMALVIQNRVSEVFAVDIHPGAKIGRGILLDHATGVVIGETAEIGDYVSILHNVTLGGTGKASGDRHPKIGNGVLIGAGTCILGNIKIGEGAKIGAGSVVLKEVPQRTTAVGNPARLVGGTENPLRLDKIPSFTMDHTSHIPDYVI